MSAITDLLHEIQWLKIRITARPPGLRGNLQSILRTKERQLLELQIEC